MKEAEKYFVYDIVAGEELDKVFTPKQAQLILLIASGTCADRALADKLEISRHTVTNTLTHIKKRLGNKQNLGSKTGLIYCLLQNNLLRLQKISL